MLSSSMKFLANSIANDASSLQSILLFTSFLTY